MAKKEPKDTKPDPEKQPSGPHPAHEMYRKQLLALAEAYADAEEHRGTMSIFTMAYGEDAWSRTRECLRAALVAMTDPQRCEPPPPPVVKRNGGE